MGKFSDRVFSEKLLAVSAAGPPAAFFQKLTCLDFSDMPILGKSVVLQRFGQNIQFECGNTEGPSMLVWDLTF